MSGLKERFAKQSAQVIGITCDGVPVLQAWAEKLGGIDFPLCSDFWPHGAVTKTYGILNEQTGRAERAIFVVDEQGIVRYIDVHQRGEVPDEEEIFAALGALAR